MEAPQFKIHVRVLCEDDVGRAGAQSWNVHSRLCEREHSLCEAATGRLGVTATRATPSFAGPLQEPKTAGQGVSGPSQVEDAAIQLEPRAAITGSNPVTVGRMRLGD